MLAFGIAIFAILLLSGSPLFIAFGLGGLIIITLYSGLPLYNLSIFFFDSIHSFILIAVPLFVLAGQLMLKSGMGKTLVDLLGSFIVRVPGGLAIAAVITSTFVGALAGSNLAVLGSVGAVLFPAMMSANYDKGYSGGVLCASSQLGFLIPPSVVFIIYGFLTNTSVAKLFIAGIMPGLLLSTLLSIAALVIAKRRKFPSTLGVSWKERKGLFIKALPALLMPIIVLGGIYGGIFTPTEAAAVASVYTLLAGIFIYRGLTWRKLWASVVEAARLSAIVLILFSGVMLLSRALTIIRLPQVIGDWIVIGGLTPAVFLLLLSIAFIALGFIMDAFAMIAIIPAVIPAVKILGIDPIHLGVLFVVASGIGTMTPPAAGALYFTSAMFKIPTIEMIRGVLPFLAVMIVGLFILAFFPQISTWLPSTMLG